MIQSCGKSLLGNKTLTIKKATDGDVIISGGQSIPANLFKKVTQVDTRFHNNAQGKLVVADLADIAAGSFQGNDIEIGFNEFYNMDWEMGDWNVAYIGADWASFGNKVHDNFVHHLMELPGAYPVEEWVFF